MLNEFNDWIVDLRMNVSRLMRLMKTSDGRDVMSLPDIPQKRKSKMIVWKSVKEWKQEFQMKEVVEEM